MEACHYTNTSSEKMIAQQISQNFQEVLHYVIDEGCAYGFVQRCPRKAGLNKFVKFTNLLFNEIEGGRETGCCIDVLQQMVLNFLFDKVASTGEILRKF